MSWRRWLGLAAARERAELLWEWARDLWTLPSRYEAALQEASRKQERIRALERQLLEDADAALERRLCMDGPPGLTAAEVERLALLAEECGEVAQAVGKVLRHGWESSSPFGGRPNRQALERELGDLTAVLYLMTDSGDLRLREIGAHRLHKRGQMARWTHHQVFGGQDGGLSQ